MTHLRSGFGLPFFSSWQVATSVRNHREEIDAALISPPTWFPMISAIKACPVCFYINPMRSSPFYPLVSFQIAARHKSNPTDSPLPPPFIADSGEPRPFRDFPLVYFFVFCPCASPWHFSLSPSAPDRPVCDRPRPPSATRNSGKIFQRNQGTGPLYLGLPLTPLLLHITCCTPSSESCRQSTPQRLLKRCNLVVDLRQSPLLTLAAPRRRPRNHTGVTYVSCSVPLLRLRSPKRRNASTRAGHGRAPERCLTPKLRGMQICTSVVYCSVLDQLLSEQVPAYNSLTRVFLISARPSTDRSISSFVLADTKLWNFISFDLLIQKLQIVCLWNHKNV
jgi:hypothetical protein